MRRRSLSVLLGLALALAWAPAYGRPGSSTGLSAVLGFSGRLRAIFALPGEALGGRLAAPARAGTYRAPGAAGPLALVVLKPFSAKVAGRIGPYRLGTWPFERGTPRDSSYEPPRGFIEVTPQNFGLRVSEHFTLGEFVTKNQKDVWPKYVVLERTLLDKLELIFDELAAMGHPVERFHIMSGFRTPEYNAPGVGRGGRSAVSRHQYGDAADIFPDDDRNGWTDDLNRDGRVSLADARLLAEAVDRVELRHPDLAGGIGVYPATSAHGPMVHVDARGKRARWGG